MNIYVKSLVILSVLFLCLSLSSVPTAAISTTTNANSGYYGYYTPNSSCFGGSYGSGYQGGYQGGYPGGYPYPGTEYCVKWIPGRWIPVTVIVPGHWEYRRVWIQRYPMTLYKPVPGYWQRSVNGVPDVSVWRGQNGGWHGQPYQQGQMSGYFDASGVWHSYQ